MSQKTKKQAKDAATKALLTEPRVYDTHWCREILPTYLPVKAVDEKRGRRIRE
jgi:hypothetical protein